MDKRTSMGVIGNLDAFAKFQAANAMEEAAKNPSGVAGVGAGMGGRDSRWRIRWDRRFSQSNASASSQSTGGQGGAGNAGGPPPLPTPFFVAINNAQVGPLDAASLRAKVASGEVTRQTLVWRQGMAAWTAADEVEDMKPFFSSPRRRYRSNRSTQTGDSLEVRISPITNALLT